MEEIYNREWADYVEAILKDRKKSTITANDIIYTEQVLKQIGALKRKEKRQTSGNLSFAPCKNGVFGSPAECTKLEASALLLSLLETHKKKGKFTAIAKRDTQDKIDKKANEMRCKQHSFSGSRTTGSEISLQLGIDTCQKQITTSSSKSFSLQKGQSFLYAYTPANKIQLPPEKSKFTPQVTAFRFNTYISPIEHPEEAKIGVQYSCIEEQEQLSRSHGSALEGQNQTEMISEVVHSPELTRGMIAGHDRTMTDSHLHTSQCKTNCSPNHANPEQSPHSYSNILQTACSCNTTIKDATMLSSNDVPGRGRSAYHSGIEAVCNGLESTKINDRTLILSELMSGNSDESNREWSMCDDVKDNAEQHHHKTFSINVPEPILKVSPSEKSIDQREKGRVSFRNQLDLSVPNYNDGLKQTSDLQFGTLLSPFAKASHRFTMSPATPGLSPILMPSPSQCHRSQNHSPELQATSGNPLIVALDEALSQEKKEHCSISQASKQTMKLQLSLSESGQVPNILVPSSPIISQEHSPENCLHHQLTATNETEVPGSHCTISESISCNSCGNSPLFTQESEIQNCPTMCLKISSPSMMINSAPQPSLKKMGQTVSPIKKSSRQGSSTEDSPCILRSEVLMDCENSSASVTKKCSDRRLDRRMPLSDLTNFSVVTGSPSLVKGINRKLEFDEKKMFISDDGNVAFQSPLLSIPQANSQMHENKSDVHKASVHEQQVFFGQQEPERTGNGICDDQSVMDDDFQSSSDCMSLTDPLIDEEMIPRSTDKRDEEDGDWSFLTEPGDTQASRWAKSPQSFENQSPLQRHIPALTMTSRSGRKFRDILLKSLSTIQRQTVEWMKKQESKDCTKTGAPVGGVVCHLDTVSAIECFLCLLTDAVRNTQPLSGKKPKLLGQTLVIAPRYLIETWDSYLRSKACLSVLDYTGPLSRRREISRDQLSRYNVVLTTYDILRAKEHVDYKNACIPCEWQDRRKLCKNSDLSWVSQVHRIEWQRLILMDTQLLIKKGPVSIRAKKSGEVHAALRWCCIDTKEMEQIENNVSSMKKTAMLLKLLSDGNQQEDSTEIAQWIENLSYHSEHNSDRFSKINISN